MALSNPRRSLPTPDRLVFLRACIQRVKPWRWATGPKTAAGKARSRMNAWKHGLRSAETVTWRKECAALMREVRLEAALRRQAAETLVDGLNESAC